MSESYQRRCLERDQLERIKKNLVRQTVAMACTPYHQGLLDGHHDNDSGVRAAREILGMKKGAKPKQGELPLLVPAA